MVMRNVPVGIRAGIAGLGQIDKSLDEASLSLRAGCHPHDLPATTLRQTLRDLGAVLE
jgi:hypothetical protein